MPSCNYIVDLKVIEGDRPDISPDDPLFFKIPADLNAGAGGKFIYLCTKRGDENPVTGLFCISGTNTNIQAPPGYTKDPIDLNHGAGGRFIYLCYSKDSDLGTPIKEVSVVIGGNANITAPTGYNKISQDLNEGAGGAFIYLCYQT